MKRDEYIEIVRDLLSGDPNLLRAANRELYTATVGCDTLGTDGPAQRGALRDADLVLAEIAQ